MAGSQAVIAHSDTGQAILIEYYPPDLHLSRMIVVYYQQMVEATSSVVFAIDRAVHSLAIACAFAQRDWNLLCMLDYNEHQSCCKTPSGPI